MQLPASALAASKITLKSGAAAPSTIYALHSYPLKVAGTSVKWVSSNKNIATIGQATGKLKPVAPGQVKITAKSINSGKAVATKTFKVLLRATDVSVSPSELTLSVGETATLAATLTPGNSTDVVRFYSDDKDIATVGLSSGKVTGKKVGETTITVYAKATKATANSSKYNKVAKVKVTVTEAKPVPTPTPNLTGVFGGLRASVSTTAATILNEGESFSVDITPVDKAGNPMSMGDMTVNPRLVVGGNATLNTGSFNVNETLSGGGASIRVIPTSTGYRIDVTGGSERCVYIVVLSVPPSHRAAQRQHRLRARGFPDDGQTHPQANAYADRGGRLRQRPFHPDQRGRRGAASVRPDPRRLHLYGVDFRHGGRHGPRSARHYARLRRDGHRPMDANRHARTGLYPLYGFWL